MSRVLGCAWSHYHAVEKGTYGAFRDYDRLRAIANELDVCEADVFEAAGMLPDNWLQLAIERIAAVAGMTLNPERSPDGAVSNLRSIQPKER